MADASIVKDASFLWVRKYVFVLIGSDDGMPAGIVGAGRPLRVFAKDPASGVVSSVDPT
ncbi:hypothetical protein [Deinococcus ficus]|uniref:hypothetical protein n=1 Tax=Deinococcus ficus TaxID=317577 RepID=UPI00174D9A46|nr:hypothetical protein [Deinococcus ficus]